jgi:hypothetical protein
VPLLIELIYDYFILVLFFHCSFYMGEFIFISIVISNKYIKKQTIYNCQLLGWLLINFLEILRKSFYLCVVYCIILKKVFSIIS